MSTVSPPHPDRNASSKAQLEPTDLSLVCLWPKQGKTGMRGRKSGMEGKSRCIHSAHLSLRELSLHSFLVAVPPTVQPQSSLPPSEDQMEQLFPTSHTGLIALSELYHSTIYCFLLVFQIYPNDLIVPFNPSISNSDKPSEAHRSGPVFFTVLAPHPA